MKHSTADAQNLVNQAYIGAGPLLERMHERTVAGPAAIGELIAIIAAWADFHAYGAVWIGGELKPCANVIEAIRMRVSVTDTKPLDSTHVSIYYVLNQLAGMTFPQQGGAYDFMKDCFSRV